jgi:hypothetical protein
VAILTLKFSHDDDETLTVEAQVDEGSNELMNELARKVSIDVQQKLSRIIKQATEGRSNVVH